VRLTFTGSNGVHYEAQWSVARARNKVTGKIQNKKWALRNLDTDFTYTKDKEIREEIALAIGLDFKQFCRTTLLAQGEFTRFLNSKDDEKAEILEKITGVDAYSRIGAKIFEQTVEKKKIWEDSQQKIEGIQILNDEEIAQKSNQLQQLDEQSQQIKNTLEKEQKKLRWLQREQDFRQRKEQAKEDLAHVKSIAESDETQQQEQTIALWNHTIEARAKMNEAASCAKTILQQEAQLQSLEQTFRQIQGAQSYELQQEQTIALSIRNIDDNLAQEAPKVNLYENAQTLNTLINSYLKNKKDAENNLQYANQIKKELSTQYQPKLENAKTMLEECQKTYNQQVIKAQEAETELEHLHLPQLRQQQEALKTLLNDIQAAKDLLELLHEEQNRHVLSKENLVQLQNSIQEKEKQLQVLTQESHDAEIRKNALQLAYEKQRESINKWAKSIRIKLQIGDTCPVCQQRIENTLPHEDNIDALVVEAEKLYKDAENEYNKILTSQNALDADIKALKNSLANEQKVFAKCSESLAKATQKAQEAAKKIPEGENGEAQTRANLEKASAQIAEAEAKEKEAKKLRTLRDQKLQEYEVQRNGMLAAQQKVDDTQHRIEVIEAQISLQNKTSEKALQDIHLLIGEAGNLSWQNDWHTMLTEFGKEVEDGAITYKMNTEKQQKLVAELKQFEEGNKNLAAVLDAIVKLMPTWGTPSKEPLMLKRIPKVLTRASELQSQITAAQQQMNAAKEKEEDTKKWLKEFMEKKQEMLKDFSDKEQEILLDENLLKQLDTLQQSDIAEKAEAINRIKQQLVSKQTVWDELEKAYQLHTGEYEALFDEDEKMPIGEKMSEEESLDTRISTSIASLEAQLSELGNQRGGIIRDLEIDRSNKAKVGSLLQESAQKKADFEKWSRLNQLLGDATGNKFRRIAQSYVLASLIHSANGYMRTLSDRYILKVVSGTFVISLEDAYQGYVSRAASTLSGGESFLVSLSLALALSDIGTQLSVDTLFIDEGFGTLSGEPLQHAVNTLRSLHSKSGRHVGIISHVEELKERIPVQIRVNQEGNNSSSTIEIVG
jgi:exonuclease SbcC